jgi:hypothetical protein
MGFQEKNPLGLGLAMAIFDEVLAYGQELRATTSQLSSDMLDYHPYYGSVNHMNSIIYPFEGIGEVRFGMTPEQVHEILGKPNVTILDNKSEFGRHTDFYDKLRVHVHYNLDLGLCEHISLVGGHDERYDGNLLEEEDDDDWDDTSYQDSFQYDQTSENLDVFIDDKLKDNYPSDSTESLDYDDSDTVRIVSPVFQEREFYGQTIGDTKPWVKSLGSAVQHTDMGFIFLKFGIGIYSQHSIFPHRDPNCLIETVTVSSSVYTDMWAGDHLTDGLSREESTGLGSGDGHL